MNFFGRAIESATHNFQEQSQLADFMLRYAAVTAVDRVVNSSATPIVVGLAGGLEVIGRAIGGRKLVGLSTTLLALSLFIQSCGSRGEAPSPADVMNAGNGTPVPEMTPGVDLVERDVDYMFGKESGTVKSVEPVCNQDRFVCAYRAKGSDGYVGGTLALGVRVDNNNHVITGWLPGGEADGDASGSLSVKSVVGKNDVGSLFDFMIQREGIGDTEYQFATWLDSNSNGSNGSDVTISMILGADNNFSFRASRNDGTNDFATGGLMTPITVEEVMGDEAQGRQMAFSSLTTDGGVLGVQFDVEKTAEEVKFDEVQALIGSQGEEYALMQDGRIQKSDGQFLEGLRMEGGKLLLGNGQFVECDPYSMKIGEDGSIEVATISGGMAIYQNGMWVTLEAGSGAVVVVTPEGPGLVDEDVQLKKIIDGINYGSAYEQVYQHLDRTFSLETGVANEEGIRPITAINQLGEKVTVATMDDSGKVKIGDVLKYKPVGFDELPPQGEAKNQLPTLEQVGKGLFRDSALLNVKVPEFDPDTVFSGPLELSGYFYHYNENFVPDSNKPLFIVLSGHYFRNEDGSVMPALTVAWFRGVGKRPAIVTAIYREKETLRRVIEAVNSGNYDPLPINTVGKSKYYLYNGKPTSRINPLNVVGQTPDYVEAYKDWADDGIPPEFTPNNDVIILIGALPGS